MSNTLYNMFVEGSDKSANSQLEAWMKANTRLKLFKYNRLMRVYVTPVLLNKFNKNITDICSKCNSCKM